jgi:hypothetical protein
MNKPENKLALQGKLMCKNRIYLWAGLVKQLQDEQVTKQARVILRASTFLNKY